MFKSVGAKCCHCNMTTRFIHRLPLCIELPLISFDKDHPIPLIHKEISIDDFFDSYNELLEENYGLKSRLNSMRRDTKDD